MGRAAPVCDRQGRDVDERVERKDDEKEGAEVVEHLDEEVPREADVGLQVRDCQAVEFEGASTSCQLSAFGSSAWGFPPLGVLLDPQTHGD